MSLIWHRRAALNTPWNPWKEPGLAGRFDADPAPNERNYVRNGANVLTWNNLDAAGTPTGVTATYATQATAGNQPPYIEVDANFRGHGSISFAAATCLKSGSFAVNQPSTHYYVVKLPAATGSAKALFATTTTSIYAQNSALTLYNGAALVSDALSVGAGVHVVCVVNKGATSLIYVDSVTPIKSGNSGTNNSAYVQFGDLVSPLLGQMACAGIFLQEDPPAVVARKLRYFGDMYGKTIT